MTSTIITKNSSTASSVPSSGSLTQGELAVNVTDKKLYTKDSGGTVVKLVGSLGNQEASAAAITGGSINGTTVGASTASTGAFTTLSASSTVSGTGFSTYLASPPAIGGTAAAAGSFTTLSASGNVTLSGGTANGVAYLNGSKVVTSGSALTFDGSKLAFGSSASHQQLDINLSTGGSSWNFGYIRLGSLGGDMLTWGGGASAYTDIVTLKNPTNNPLVFGVNNSEQMRLTSTGLGIGTSSPAAKLHVQATQASMNMRSTGTGNPYIDFYTSTSSLVGNIYGIDGGGMAIGTTGGTERLRVDGSGNLGLGVTPSAWNADYKNFAVGTGGEFYGRVSTTEVGFGSNYYRNSGGSYIYLTSAAASYQAQVGGVHYWFNAASGTAGNAITFTQAATLTAGGNYLLGTTSDYLASRLLVKTTSTDSSTNALTLQNSAATDLFRVRSDGYTYAGFYAQTTASAANVTIASGGDLLRSTSALKYKQDIRDIEEMDIDLLRPVRYKSKCANDDQTKDHLGLIADEAAEAGFEELVIRGDDGEVEGFQYERLTVVLLKTVQSLRQRVATLEAK